MYSHTLVRSPATTIGPMARRVDRSSGHGAGDEDPDRRIRLIVGSMMWRRWRMMVMPKATGKSVKPIMAATKQTSRCSHHTFSASEITCRTVAPRRPAPAEGRSFPSTDGLAWNGQALWRRTNRRHEQGPLCIRRCPARGLARAFG